MFVELGIFLCGVFYVMSSVGMLWAISLAKWVLVMYSKWTTRLGLVKGDLYVLDNYRKVVEYTYTHSYAHSHAHQVCFVYTNTADLRTQLDLFLSDPETVLKSKTSHFVNCSVINRDHVYVMDITGLLRQFVMYFHFKEPGVVNLETFMLYLQKKHPELGDPFVYTLDVYKNDETFTEETICCNERRADTLYKLITGHGLF